MHIISPQAGLPEPIAKEHFLINSQCISEKTFEDLVGKQADIVDWKLDIPFDLDLKGYLELKCDKCNPGLKKIIPTIQQANPVLIYHDCIANNYSSMRRDCIGLPVPERDMLTRFEQFSERIFEREIKPLLQNFEYSVSAYYNHLDHKQQRRWDTVDKTQLHRRIYGNFCKLEKQEITSQIKNPKNRNIASPNEEYKYVMGPIVYRLEQIMKKKQKGYASGRSWTQREHLLNQRANKMLSKLIQGDGSGFDRTQYASLKQTCEMRIYRYLADAGYVYHVDEATFLLQALCQKVTFNVRQMEKSGKYTEIRKLGRVVKKGTVQSGNCDTTFGNTYRMVMYIRFIAEELLELSPEEYDLDCAGDDFALFLSPYKTDESITRAFYQAFRPLIKGETDAVKHGIGQVLKYLKIGGIESCDFCSTETFWSEKQQSYKIIRKIDRFFTLTPYSRKCLQFSYKDQLHYLQSLYISNAEWIGNLPLLSAYNKLIGTYSAYASHKYNPDIKSKKGLQKKHVPLEKPHYAKLYDEAAQARFDNLRLVFDSDDAYAMMDRVSDKSGCEDDFYDYLSRTYSLTRAEVDQASKIILEAINKPLNHIIDLPILKIICDQKLLREAELMHSHVRPDGSFVWLDASDTLSTWKQPEK